MPILRTIRGSLALCEKRECRKQKTDNQKELGRKSSNGNVWSKKGIQRNMLIFKPVMFKGEGLVTMALSRTRKKEDKGRGCRVMKKQENPANRAADQEHSLSRFNGGLFNEEERNT